ncbi:MAG: hypothetical protein B6242_01340 [Anaerolineaceae bacterium 4572_78]|nr:MAG: hypothetical protein B6242_01340 [Anaerolineaceae bacterium 4572_78]
MTQQKSHQSISNDGRPIIESNVTEALIDEKIEIQLSGLEPYQTVVLRAEMTDEAYTVWKSMATFKTDKHGKVDLGNQAPMLGSYNCVDAMGLFWSMFPQNITNLDAFAKNNYSHFIKLKLDVPVKMVITAKVDSKSVAVLELQRNFIAPDVTVKEIRRAGLVGWYYKPAGEGPYPGMLLLHGADGVPLHHEAALLASRGIASFAVKYFSRQYNELPDHLNNMPLEYFKKAIKWMRDDGKCKKVALFGTSKGAEAVLLTASLFPDIVDGVIVQAPSSVPLTGFKRKQPNHPPWLYEDEPLPYMPLSMWLGDKIFLATSLFLGLIPPMRKFYARGNDNQVALDKLAIRVENITCPIFMACGDDDQTFPAKFHCDRIINRLRAHRFDYTYHYEIYRDAGHMFSYPYLPSSMSNYYKNPSKSCLVVGGNPESNATAAVDFWKKTLNFMETHLST